ncbi:porin family protein [Phenylobacterium sp.]|jgi:opacity protein-like surface antigen|uniref:porin family protein n=1 Tax=Phenylobacterium sp. TaxID=1871053 RepID=UPI002F95EA2B
MKTLIAAASAAVLATLVPAMAQAQTATTGLYGNLGYSQASSDDINLGAIGGRVGWRFNDWLGVEGELGFGVKDDTVTEAGIDVDIELEHTEAIYAVGFAPLSANTDLLARIGYGNTSIKGSALGTSVSEDGDSWNYGVGVQHHFDGVNGIRFDYTRQEYRGDDAGSSDVWSISYSRRF